MARHVWSLLCEKTVIEAGTQALSILNVYEEVQAKVMVPDGTVVADDPLVPLPLTIVSAWERSNLNVEEERESVRVRIVDPHGKELGTHEQVFSMKGAHLRARVILSIAGLPVRVSGRYIFEILGRKGRRWNIEATVPLVVNISVGYQSKLSKPS
jgi:hypothetical protein